MTLDITRRKARERPLRLDETEDGDGEMSAVYIDTHEDLDELRATNPRDAVELYNPVTLQKVTDAQSEDVLFKTIWAGKPGTG